ncbi:MAG: EAL domain-containing protein [Betaproteobacteria bacterium]|nr:EAL domain-containing protein [Betaproteobacteria bacterium]
MRTYVVASNLATKSRLVKRVVTSPGAWLVGSSSDPREAVDVAQTTQPEVIVAGIEPEQTVDPWMLSEIRNSVPGAMIVAVVDDPAGVLAQYCRAAGADHVIDSRDDREGLHRVLASVVAQARTEKPHERPTDPRAEPAEAVPGIDPHETSRALAELRQVSVDDCDAILCDIVSATRRVTFVSLGAERLLGFKLEWWLQNPNFFRDVIEEEDREGVFRLLDMVAADGASRTLELRVNTANGGSVWLKGRAMRAGADKGSGTVRCFLTDITEFKLAQARLAAATTRDPVTGFINRTALKELLGQKIAEAGRRGESVAALILTIDRFRLLRDSLGSEMSDQVLIGLGGRVRSALGEADILCRHGDDEFAIVLDDARGDESIACVATRLLRGIADPIEIGAEEFRLTCSIGIALCPPNGRDADMLLRSAAAAAYVARHGGGNAFRFFAPDMNDRAEQRFGLERDLRRAIERGEFELNYQPQMDAEGTALVGAEALLRWKHPQRGEIEPSRFIPLAEEVGLITDIGEWVASEVTRQMALWWRDGLAVPRVAINVSCAQFRNGFVDHLALCLEEHGVRPDRIEVEITESLMMEDLPEVSRAMARLRAMGVRIAIDDFGTGYSSLAVLQRLAPDALKIDRQFADSVDTHPAGGAIVKAIVGMADALGLEVVAEGVETQAQFRSLAQLGCTLFQGRLWSMPASAAQFGARFLGSPPVEVPAPT